MADHLSAPPKDDATERPGSPRSKLNRKDIAGTISKRIGTGKNARDSFIWMTITWSFYVAGGVTLLLFVRAVMTCFQGTDFVEDIKSVWSLFVPIITLALGYAFGKGEGS